MRRRSIGVVLVAFMLAFAPALPAAAYETAGGGARTCTSPRTITSTSQSSSGIVEHEQYSGGTTFKRSWWNSATQYRTYNAGRTSITGWFIETDNNLYVANITCVN